MLPDEGSASGPLMENGETESDEDLMAISAQAVNGT
uniref:Uncharacterized protein n=1 Tax=Arundo donax TaxID=35708 RepID=A0A0A9A5S0_ARUDO